MIEDLELILVLLDPSILHLVMRRKFFLAMDWIFWLYPDSMLGCCLTNLPAPNWRAKEFGQKFASRPPIITYRYWLSLVGFVSSKLDGHHWRLFKSHSSDH
jgi:hypothetical protein